MISREKTESLKFNPQKDVYHRSAHPKKSFKLMRGKSGILYHGIIRALPDLIIMSDIEGNLIYASDVAISMFGIKNIEEAIGTSVFDWISPDEHERLSKSRREIINGVSPKNSIYTAIRKDGSTFPIEVHNARLNDKDGNPIGTVAILRDITEKKEKEARLNYQDMLLNVLFESTPGIRLILDINGRIIKSNEEGARKLGLGIEEIPGREIFDFFPEQIRDSKKKEYHKFTENPEPYHGRCKHEGRWYDIHVDPILDVSGSLAQISVIAADITDKITVMEKFVQSEERYRSLFDNSHTVMLLIDPLTMNIVDANRAAVKFYGYSHEEITSLKITDINQTSPEIFAVNAINSVNGKTNTIIVPHRLADGEVRKVEVFTNPVMIGHKSFLFSVVHDITEKKFFEQQICRDNPEKKVTGHARQLKKTSLSINKASDEWQKTFDSVQDMIWLINDDMRILRFNQASRERYGSDIEGKHCCEVVHGTEEPLPECPVLKMKKSKKRESVELELNGRWKLITVDPVLDRNNNITSAVHIISDITDRKKAEADRIAIVQQHQQAQRIDSIEMLAGGIAHDFNNLLMAILGNIELALFDENTSDVSRKYLNSAAKAVHKASELTSHMLAYAGKGRNIIEDTCLNRIIKNVMPVFDQNVSNRITIVSDLDPALPMISVDVDQMRLIIINLVINASEAIGDNPGVITISTGTVSCKKKDLETPWPDDALAEGRYVFLKVSDTGCGMDRHTKQRIFDPFFTTKFFGRGLGMAAVQGIVKKMRGTIRIESEPGKGSSFCVLLPAQSQPAEISLASQAETGNRQKKTILLVDDEQIVLNVGKKMLEVLGFNVITAVNGADAVEIFRKNREQSNKLPERITCIVLDLVMPVMNGEEALVKFRQIDPDIPVVVISGYPEDIIKKKIEFKDIQQVVMKPFEMGHLCKKIIEALGEDHKVNSL
ncbi:MAG TPA: PAS domain S-box protein [Desulfomonilia bacterium]